MTKDKAAQCGIELRFFREYLTGLGSNDTKRGEALNMSRAGAQKYRDGYLPAGLINLLEHQPLAVLALALDGLYAKNGDEEVIDKGTKMLGGFYWARNYIESDQDMEDDQAKACEGCGYTEECDSDCWAQRP